jgi:hypothetical protein
MLSGSSCICITGYVDAGSGICEKCDVYLPGCTMCTSVIECDRCNDAGYFVLVQVPLKNAFNPNSQTTAINTLCSTAIIGC